MIGKVVRIKSDNGCYSDWLDRDLVITDAVNSVRENQFYDSSINGMYLCDLEDLVTRESVPFSLYEYEFEEV